MSVLRSLVSRLVARGSHMGETDLPLASQVLETQEAVFVVGDLHGCADVFRRLEDEILDEMSGAPAHIVLLGDLIDRGPATADLLDHILSPPPQSLRRHAILGNHERMFQRFLSDPKRHGAWLQHGGRETLSSYGIDTMDFEAHPSRRKIQIVEAFVPADHRAFLAGLPARLHWGNCLFTHAGLDPTKPVAAQNEYDLLWNTTPPAAGDVPKDLLLIHGHVPVTMPDLSGPVIGMDVGTYKTGRGCALRLDRGRPAKLIHV